MVEPDLRRVKRVALYVGPVLAATVAWLAHTAGLGAPAAWTAAITALCGVWWVFEPIPLAATSLIPFALLPMGGVLTHKQVAGAYGHHLVLLMIGGCMVSTAMERSGAHRRVAVGLVRIVGGTGARRLVLGFLLASSVLSMWMSNTATTVMLLPVALAVLSGRDDDLGVPVLLAVAYGASIGGSGTPIGTPPNVVFMEHFDQRTGREMSFTEWMGYGLPVMAVMIPAAWLWLTRRVRGGAESTLPALGPWRPEERRVLVVFALMALAWLTRSGPGGGWARALGVEGHAGDSTVALLAVLALFVIPRGPVRADGHIHGPGERLLDWETAQGIPWGIFLLIGGGIAIGMAFDASQLDAELGEALTFLGRWPPWIVVPGLCLVATFATEVTSNTATANVFMPILGAAAAASQTDPLWLMLPAALGLNHAFMLPVATAPNAIMYGTGHVSAGQMVREGFALNVIGVAVISVVCMLRI